MELIKSLIKVSKHETLRNGQELSCKTQNNKIFFLRNMKKKIIFSRLYFQSHVKETNFKNFMFSQISQQCPQKCLIQRLSYENMSQINPKYAKKM